MPILNYTTEVEALKSANEIQQILAAHGAISIKTDYENGHVAAIAFAIEHPKHGRLAFRLPANVEAVYRVLVNQLHSWKEAEKDIAWSDRARAKVAKNRQQAERVCWRILRTWVAAQMATLETEMVKMEEIFLPYLIVDKNNTLFNSMVDRGFYLAEGKG